MKKDIFRFGRMLLIIIVVLVTFDLAVGLIGDTLAWNMPNYSGQIAKDNYRLHRANQEVVILGSSRGAHHYVTSQLNDSIDNFVGRHVSVYNAAIQGKFANSNCCAAEVIISRYKPKLVIIDMPINQMTATDISSDIEFSSPFYKRDSIVRRYIDNLGRKEKILNKSSLYRYNNKFIRIIFSYFHKVGNDDGYVPLYGSTVSNIDFERMVRFEDIPFNPYTKDNFITVINKYKEAGVTLIIICSPKYKSKDNNKQLNDLCEQYGVPFIDMCNIKKFNDHSEWFHDAGHLNDDGAREFTALFYQTIKPFIDTLK